MSSLCLVHITSKHFYWGGPSRCWHCVKNVPGSETCHWTTGVVCPCWVCASCALPWAVASKLCSAVPCQLPQGSSCFRTGLWWRGWEGARPVSASLHMVASVTHTKAGGVHPGLAEWFTAISALCSETSDYGGVWWPVWVCKDMRDSPRLGWMAKKCAF